MEASSCRYYVALGGINMAWTPGAGDRRMILQVDTSRGVNGCPSFFSFPLARSPLEAMPLRTRFWRSVSCLVVIRPRLSTHCCPTLQRRGACLKPKRPQRWSRPIGPTNMRRLDWLTPDGTDTEVHHHLMICVWLGRRGRGRGRGVGGDSGSPLPPPTSPFWSKVGYQIDTPYKERDGANLVTSFWMSHMFSLHPVPTYKH